jgi:cell division septation protein DedD
MSRNARILAMTVASVLACTMLAGCSREKIDWKSAEAADTVEGYDRFLERHPDGALATQARARVAQLMEDRDWKRATSADTAESYREFLAQHESGKWAEEARIRVENFSLDGTATGPAKPAPLDAAPAVAATPAAAPPLPAHGPKEAQSPPTAAGSSAAAAAKPAPPVKPAEPKRVAAATPPTPAAKPATAPPAPSPHFGIQLGAFRSQDAALKNWKQLQTKYDSDLHGLFAHAVPVKQTSGDLFRLQAPVGEESRARAICASLSKQSQPCVVVLPKP